MDGLPEVNSHDQKWQHFLLSSIMVSADLIGHKNDVFSIFSWRCIPCFLARDFGVMNGHGQMR